MPDLPNPLETFYSTAKAYGALRQLQEPSTAERWAFAEQADQAKMTLNILNELHKTGNEATKSHIADLLKEIAPTLSPLQRTAASAIINHSPLNPLKQKEAQFDQEIPMPRVTADPVANPYGYLQQLVSFEDWKTKKQAFMTGQAPKYKRIFNFDEKGEVFGIRQDDGSLQLWSGEMLGMKSEAEKMAGPGAFQKAMLNNGEVWGDTRSVLVDGQVMEVRKGLNVLNSQGRIETRGGDKAFSRLQSLVPDESIRTQMKEEQRFLSQFTSYAAIEDLDDEVLLKDPAGRAYLGFKKLKDKGASPTDIQTYLKSHFPNYNFYFGKKEEGIIWDSWLNVPNAGLMAWPGVAKPFTTADGKAATLYHDARTDRVYAEPGIEIGTYDQAVSYVGGVTLAALQGEASERKGLFTRTDGSDLAKEWRRTTEAWMVLTEYGSTGV